MGLELRYDEPQVFAVGQGLDVGQELVAFGLYLKHTDVEEDVFAVGWGLDVGQDLGRGVEQGTILLGVKRGNVQRKRK